MPRFLVNSELPLVLIMDRHRHVVSNRQAHGEGRVHGAGVAFRDRHVVDGNPRFVVEDGADPLAIGNGRVGRGAEVDDEGLVGLGETVAVMGTCR